MSGHIFVAHGDLTQLSADAIVYSASTYLLHEPSGHLFPAFKANVPGFATLAKDLPASCAIGDAFWVRLSGDRKPRGVVVVAAAGGGRTLSREQKTQLAVRNALETAIAELRKILPAGERLLIALPTFRQGVGGDRNVRHQSARLQIAAAHDVLQAHADVDAAFVTYTADSYRIYLQARRDLGLAPACPLPEEPSAELRQALHDERCVLFLGAGLSAGAGLPGWQAFIDHLAGELGVASDRSDLEYFLDLAQWYAEKRGAAALTELIHHQFAAAEARPTLAHYLLLSLPVRLVLTTNYDDLLERALTGLRRYPVTVVKETEVVYTGQSDGVCVVKLHGDARRREGIVLSRDDYDGFFRNRPALALLLEGLLLNQTFLFAGYSLRDPNFRQVYSRIADMLRGAKRDAFAVTVDAGTETSPFLIRQWRNKNLHLLPMRGETLDERVQNSLRFFDWLADQVASRTPGLFLAHDVPLAGPLEELRRHLMSGVGPALEDACGHVEAEGDVRYLAAVLEFLTLHGWRPGAAWTRTLGQLWEELATKVQEPTLRRRMLITALRYTERFDHAERIRQRLEEVGKEGPERGPP
jgi:O-acetyl-ADP-ribose deacetylase (regulator of RNase III)